MELKKIVKYRNIWLGVAMLCIVFFHSGFVTRSTLLSAVKTFSYIGVDICVFASGLGCYFSLDKDPDAVRFLKRRIRRLAPVYYCFILPWLLWKYAVSRLPLNAVLGNLLGIQSLVSWDYHFNWYISGLLVFYFLMPYMKRMTDSRAGLLGDAGIAVFLLAASVPFWHYNTILIILSRLPVLYAGAVCGKLAKQNYVLKVKDFILLAVMAAVGAALLLYVQRFPDELVSWGLCWYPFVLIVPGGCVFLSLAANLLEGRKFLGWINKLLRTVGVYSFEVYLVHDFLYEGLIPRYKDYFVAIPNNLLWALTIPVVICGTYVLNRVAAAVSGIPKKIKKA